jgi:hypothetical protein
MVKSKSQITHLISFLFDEGEKGEGEDSLEREYGVEDKPGERLEYSPETQRREDILETSDNFQTRKL